MNKLEELKQFVAQLFDTATDKTVIEKSAVVNQKIEEIQQEQNKKDQEYRELLKDYKDAIIHTSFKPNPGDNSGGVPGNFDPEEAFKKFFLTPGDKK